MFGFGNLVCILDLLINTNFRLFESWFFKCFPGRTLMWLFLFPGGSLTFWSRKRFSIDGLFWPGNDAVFFWVLDLRLILSGRYWWLLGEGIMGSYFEFWVMGICFNAGRIKWHIFFSRDKKCRYRHCYQGGRRSRGDKRPSTCSLPDWHYVHVIYGGMIHDWRMYENHKII